MVDVNSLNVEHQIRICDTTENILKAFNLESKKFKRREIYYLEDNVFNLKNNKLIIKIKTKSPNIEVDLKKRININEIDQYSINDCEFDKHENYLDLTCKYKNINSEKKLEELKDNTIHWQNILSSEQLNVLENVINMPLDLKLFGTLVNDRYTLKDQDFSEISIDLVSLKTDTKFSFHEVSVRYPYKELALKSKQFESYILNTGLKSCPNQKDWEINKFDVLVPFP